MRKLTPLITALVMCVAAAPTIARPPAPTLTITGEALDWTAMGETTQYQLRTIDRRAHERSETDVTGVTDTPPADPGERVAYRVRALAPSPGPWSNTVVVDYPGQEGAQLAETPVVTITGRTYYVSPSGSDANSGDSPDSAWRTVRRVNEARLKPGDGVLFEGGATFADETLTPDGSGTAGSPIVLGSYGKGDANLAMGVWFRKLNHLAFEHLNLVGPDSYLQGTGNDITVEWCTIGSDGLAINATGANSDWTIDENTVNDTGNSGMLLEGKDFTVSENTITNTGLDSSIPYGKHGIYLKVANATVTDNTITNFSSDGISARYHNSLIEGNHISGGPVGIAWFQMQRVAGTSYWIGNTITNTTAAGIYASTPETGASTPESFVIDRNTIEPSAGVFMALEPTGGTYTTLENTLL